MPTNNNSYFIRIQPLGNFFFGGENTFNTVEVDNSKKRINLRDPAKKDADDSRTNYFARSQQLPQQTAVLGMLRHALLMYNNAGSLLDATEEIKAGKVGAQSFIKGYPGGYGLIEEVSPVMLCNKPGDKERYDLWLPAGLNRQFYSEDKENKKMDKIEKEIKLDTSQEGNTCFETKETLTVPLIRGVNYDYKEDLENRWMRYPHDATVETKGGEDIFQEVTKVGIYKSKSQNGDDDQAFYKQTFLQLKDGFQFGVYIKTTADIELSEMVFFMPFGGDQSEFKITVEQADWPDFLNQQTPAEGLQKITLLSDSYLHPSLLQDCMFAISRSNNFRYIQSRIGAADFYKNSGLDKEKKQGRHKVENKINLLQRGSVLFTEDPKTVIDRLTGTTADESFNNEAKSFRRIGYNYFLIEKN
jgi:CRISPR-associated protein Cmr3